MRGEDYDFQFSGRVKEGRLHFRLNMEYVGDDSQGEEEEPHSEEAPHHRYHLHICICLIVLLHFTVCQRVHFLAVAAFVMYRRLHMPCVPERSWYDCIVFTEVPRREQRAGCASEQDHGVSNRSRRRLRRGYVGAY